MSSLTETEINLPFITADSSGPKHLQMKLTRAKFEQLTEDLVESCRKPFESALTDSGLSAKDLDEVLLVGGATRMPMIQELVQSLTDKAPNQSVNPDEVVSEGAAIQAGILTGQVEDVLLLDVTPLSLGLETMGAVMTTLIPRNTTLPTRKMETFSTADDNQTAVDIHVLQGERPMAHDNKTLGKFQLDGIPSAPRGVPQIDVTFDIDANGILHVTAKDKATGKEQKIEITASTNLTEADVEQMIRDAKEHDIEDKQQRELAEIRNQADQSTYLVEKTLKELGDRVSATERSKVEKMVKDLRSAIQKDDATEIRSLVEELQQASYALSQQLQHHTQGEAKVNGSQDDKGDDVIEGEFQEL